MRRIIPGACRGALVLFLAAVAGVTFFFQEARADIVRGYVDLLSSRYRSQTTTPGVGETTLDSGVFRQQYNLHLNTTLYPNLTLLAGGLLEKDLTKTEIQNEEITTRSTSIRPFVDLTLRTPFVTAGGGYSKRESEIRTSGSASTTNVSEEYYGVFGLRPEGLPSVDTRVNRTNRYDKNRLGTDTVDDLISLTSLYEPVKNLMLRYNLNDETIRDKVNLSETTNRAQAGKATYDAQFLDKRVSVYASYDITQRVTEADRVQLFSFTGLYAIDDTPDDGPLSAYPSLVDSDTLTSTGINLGVPPSPGGDTRPRNIGADFLVASELNTLFVWVDRELPTAIAQSFLWSVYTSADNATWTQLTAPAPAAFGPFQNRFEITFPNTTTRYLKVVVSPLTAAAAALVPTFTNPDRIFVTEIQTFLQRPAGSQQTKTTSTVQLSNLNLRARLLDAVALFYELTYQGFRTETASAGLSTVTTQSTLSNGLSASRQFSQAVSGAARIAREDISDRLRTSVAYVWNASLKAVPLKTLGHTLTYSGRSEKSDEGTLDRNSLFLYNTAELYKGIDAYLSGGLNLVSLDTGRREHGMTLVFGANVVPHPVLTVTPSYSYTEATQTGGSVPDLTTYTRRSEVNVAYYPVRTLYLVGSVARLAQTGRRDTTKNYSVTWSPFSGGALQFSFAYNEITRTFDNSIEKYTRPAVRWDINSRMYVELVYLILRDSQGLQETNAETATTNFHYTF